MAGKVVTTAAPTKQETAGARSYVGSAAKQFQGSAKVQEKVGGDARNVNYYRGSAAYSASHPGTKFNNYDQRHYMDTVRGAVDRDREIGQLNDAYSYLTSGKTDRESTSQWLDMANNNAKNSKDEEFQGYWSSLANDFGELYKADSNASKQENDRRIAELNTRIQDVTNKARSASDVVTYWDSQDGSKPSQERANYLNWQLKQLNFQKAALEEDNAKINQALHDTFATPEVLYAEQLLRENNFDRPYWHYDHPEEYTREQAQKIVDDFYAGLGDNTPHFYNKRDEWVAGIKAFKDRTEASLLGATSWSMQVEELTQNNIPKFDKFGRPVMPEENRQQALDKITITNPREGNEIRAGLDNRIEALEKEKQELKNTFKTPTIVDGETRFHSRTLTESTKAMKEKADSQNRMSQIDNELRLLYGQRDNIDFQLKTMSGEETTPVEKLMNMDSREFGQYLNQKADERDQRSSEVINALKQGKSELARAGIDIGLTLGDIFMDQAVGIATGTGEVGSLSSMFVRVFGSSVNEARRTQDAIYNQKATEASLKGLPAPERNYENELLKQGAYAGAHAAIEVITEKIGDVYKLYGGSLAGDWIDDLVMKSADTYVGQVFYRSLYGGMSEAGEEILSWLLDPFCEWIIDESKRGHYLDQLDVKEGAYDALMGFMASLVFTPISIANGSERAGYQERQQAALDRDYADRNAIAKESAERVKGTLAGPDTIARRVIDAGVQETSRGLWAGNGNRGEWNITRLLEHPEELRIFERETGQKVQGITDAEKRASIKKILDSGSSAVEQIANESKAKQEERAKKNSAVTKAHDKAQQLKSKYSHTVKGEDGKERIVRDVIPENEQLSRQEASILRDAGIISKTEFNWLALAPGKRHMTADEIRAEQKKADYQAQHGNISGGGNNKAGYIERNAQTDAHDYTSKLGVDGKPLAEQENADTHNIAMAAIHRAAEEEGKVAPVDDTQDEEYDEGEDESAEAKASEPASESTPKEEIRKGKKKNGDEVSVRIFQGKDGRWCVRFDNGLELGETKKYVSYEKAKEAYDKIIGRHDGFNAKRAEQKAKQNNAPKSDSKPGDIPAPPKEEKTVKPASTASESSPESETPEQKTIREQGDRIRQLEEQNKQTNDMLNRILSAVEGKPAPENTPAKKKEKQPREVRDAEKAAEWRKANDQLAAENEARRIEDNKKLKEAKDNKTEVSFDFEQDGKQYRITWSGKSYVATIYDADGKVVFNDDFPAVAEHLINGERIRPGSINKVINKLRSTLKTSRGMAPVEQKTVEAENTEAAPAEPEAAPEEPVAADPAVVQRIRDAKSIKELNDLFWADDEAFTAAYREITGEEFNDRNAQRNIEALYDELHPEETTEDNAPAEPQEPATPVTPETPAEPETPADNANTSTPPENPEPRKIVGAVDGTTVVKPDTEPYTADKLQSDLNNKSVSPEELWAKVKAAVNNGQLAKEDVNSLFTNAVERSFTFNDHNKGPFIKRVNAARSITEDELAKRRTQKEAKAAADALVDIIKTTDSPAEYINAYFERGISTNGFTPEGLAALFDESSHEREAFDDNLYKVFEGKDAAIAELNNNITFVEDAIQKWLESHGGKIEDGKGKDLLVNFGDYNDKQKAIITEELANQIKDIKAGKTVDVEATRKAIDKKFAALKKGEKANVSDKLHAGRGRESEAGRPQGVETQQQPETGVAGKTALAGKGHAILNGQGKTKDGVSLLNAALDDYGATDQGERDAHIKRRYIKLKGLQDNHDLYVLPEEKQSEGIKELSDYISQFGINLMTVLTGIKTSYFNLGGYVDQKAPMFGPTIIVDRTIPNNEEIDRSLVNKTGDDAAHELGHWFGGLAMWQGSKWVKEGRNAFGELVPAHREYGKLPDYADGINTVGKKSGISNFQHYMLVMYIDKVGVSAAEKAFKTSRGINSLTKEQSDKIAAEWKTKTTTEQQLAYVLGLAGTKRDSWKKLAYEECLMELSSNGPMFARALTDDGFDAPVLQQAARDWLEDKGGVPKGFYAGLMPIVEKLNAEHDAFLAKYDKRVAKQRAAGKKIEAELKSQQANSTQDVKEEIISPKAPKNYKPAADKFRDAIVKPETERMMSQSAETQQKTTAGERVQMGPLTHDAISKAEMKRSAEASLKKGLNDPDIGWRGVYGFFKNQEPGRLLNYEQAIADTFVSRLNAERTIRGSQDGKIFDTTLPADYERLSQLADEMAPYAAASHSSAGSKLGLGTVQPKFEEVINDAKRAYVGDIKPDDIDWKSEPGKMVSVVVDHAMYTKSIEDRYDAAKEAKDEAGMKQATQDMVKEILQVNQVRDVSKTFGPAGKIMQDIESKFLARVANKSPEAFETLKAMAYSSIDRISYDFNKVGVVNTVKQIRYMNMLSNVATIINNVMNNLESATSGATAQNLGMLVAGKKANKLMGGEDSMSKNYNYLGFLSKTNRELNSYMLTKGAESVLSLYYGLDMDEGKYETGMETARHNQNSNGFGKFLATFQFLSGIGMQTTDQMAIERAYRGMLKGIDEMNVSEARKEELRKDALWEAKRQMYHNDDGLAKTMSSLRDWANKLVIAKDANGTIGAGDILMPFVAVPVNVATRAMRATVPGQLVGIVNYARGMKALSAKRAQFDEAEKLRTKMRKPDGSLDFSKLSMEERLRYDQIKSAKAPTDAEVRKCVRTLGEVMNNALMTVLGGIATAFGALKNFDDEDDEEAKRLAKEKGFTGLQFNLTKMITRPFDKEWRDDDIVLGGSWLEVMALPFAAGNTIMKSALDPDEGQSAAVSAVNAVLASPLSTFDDFVDVVTEMPGMNQMMDIWNAYESLSWSNNFEEAFKQAVGSTVSQYSANTISSFFIPNLVSQASAGFDNKVRDVYNADSNLKVAGRIILNKTPFRYKLPEAKSSLNETRTYGQDRARGVLNRMILPGTGVKVWKQSDLEKEYAALRAAGYGGVAAAASAPKNIKIDGVKYGLNADERSKFDADYTQMVNDWQNQLLHTPGYKEMSPEQRDAAMTDVRTLANLICEHNAIERKKNDGLVPADVDVDFKNWEAQYQNDPEGLNKFLVGKYQLKQFYGKNKEGAFEVRDYSGLDNYLKTDYMKLDETARDLLDTSYPSIDKMYNAQKEAGIDSKQYMELYDVYKNYNNLASDAEARKASDQSVSEIARNMIVEMSKHVSDEKLDWAIDNFAIYTPIRANIKTPEKLVANTSLDWTQTDRYLDDKSKLQPTAGHKGVTMNQVLMFIRDDKSLTPEQQWELVEHDGDVSDSAWAHLAPYMEKGYKGSDGTLAYAMAHANWYRPTRFSGYKKMRYDVIYDDDWNVWE